MVWKLKITYKNDIGGSLCIQSNFLHFKSPDKINLINKFLLIQTTHLYEQYTTQRHTDEPVAVARLFNYTKTNQLII